MACIHMMVLSIALVLFGLAFADARQLSSRPDSWPLVVSLPEIPLLQGDSLEGP